MMLHYKENIQQQSTNPKDAHHDLLMKRINCTSLGQMVYSIICKDSSIRSAVLIAMIPEIAAADLTLQPPTLHPGDCNHGGAYSFGLIMVSNG